MATADQLGGQTFKNLEDTETSIMADELVKLIYSSIDQREQCAEHLRKLAQKLKTKWRINKCLRNGALVFGVACLIGAIVAAIVTAEAAALALGVVGAVHLAAGVKVYAENKITMDFFSSKSMKGAQEAEKMNKDIADQFKELLEKLKAKRKKVSSITDPDELDRHIMMDIMRAMARRSGLNLEIDQSFLMPEVTAGLADILTLFTALEGDAMNDV